MIGKGEIFKNKVYPKTTLPFPIYTFRPTITTSHKITVQNRYTNCIFRKNKLRCIDLYTGSKMPVLGLGTWHHGSQKEMSDAVR